MDTVYSARQVSTKTGQFHKHLDDRALVAGNKATINLQLVYGVLLTLGVWLG